MVDNVTIEIAAAVAGKIAESVTQRGIDGVKALHRHLRNRFGDNNEAQETFTEACDNGGEDTDLVKRLAAYIEEVRGSDPEVQRLIEELRPEFTSDGGDVYNTISGKVSGTAIQARDIQGGLHIGG